MIQIVGSKYSKENHNLNVISDFSFFFLFIGRIITIESQKMKVLKMKKFDPDCSNWYEVGERLINYVFVIRIFYEVMDGISEEIGIFNLNVITNLIVHAYNEVGELVGLNIKILQRRKLFSFLSLCGAEFFSQAKWLFLSLTLEPQIYSRLTRSRPHTDPKQKAAGNLNNPYICSKSKSVCL